MRRDAETGILALMERLHRRRAALDATWWETRHYRGQLQQLGEEIEQWLTANPLAQTTDLGGLEGEVLACALFGALWRAVHRQKYAPIEHVYALGDTQLRGLQGRLIQQLSPAHKMPFIWLSVEEALGCGWARALVRDGTHPHLDVRLSPQQTSGRVFSDARGDGLLVRLPRTRPVRRAS